MGDVEKKGAMIDADWENAMQRIGNAFTLNGTHVLT